MYYDVIIAGFGTSGSIAAVAAARQGMKVLVLEKNTYGGGTHTGGNICGYYDGEPDGLTRELNMAVADMITDSGYLHPEAPQEIKIIIYEQEVLKYGGRIIYEACVSDVIMDGKTFKGLIWYDADGKHKAEAKVLIDGSADAIFCAMAGCELDYGRASDGLFQDFTNSSAYLWKDMHVWASNADAGRINQYNAEEYSKLMLCSSTRHLRDSYSDKESRLIKACDLPGLREGAHIISETPMHLADFFADKIDLSEPIAWTKVIFDNHSKDVAFESELFQDWEYSGMRNEKVNFGVPRGAIIPKGYNGILTAGRHLGVDHSMSFALRMNGCLSRVGEAAGVLASLAVKLDLAPLEVPFNELEKIIKTGPGPLSRNKELWALSSAEIKAGLASELPGRAVWSARTNKYIDLLKEIIAENKKDSNSYRHAALALALLGDKQELPFIRKMATEHSSIPVCCHRRKHDYGYIAVYLIGRLRDPVSIPLLKEILNDNELTEKNNYHSNAVTALLKIGDNNPTLRAEIAAILKKTAEDPSWYLESQLAPGIMKRCDGLLRIHIANRLNQWGIIHNITATLQKLDLNEN